ncbi:sensor histidine kinase [Metabacillus halosaccharovorans]|uniref:sensor histidine kinase n=1 Tax=Metabacillus halosaccharovorans TaxID=930124 RepID=UPI00203D914E|nr:histidine kinase [Metabacillus halosaccharovorans]MCM3439747.1 histidine kinase [Metabacillus halosaccharovorans]
MNKKLISNPINRVTFKNRIIFIFLISTLIPFICLGVISFYTIDSIIDNKVENSIQSKLKQDLTTLENSLNNLNHVSQQLAFGGRVTTLLDELQKESEPSNRIQLIREINSEINLISFSNPNIGLIMYYYPDTGLHDFENFRLRNEFMPEKLPVMAKYSGITYYGPHKSYSGSINQFVFSSMRKVNILDQTIYLYIETGRNALETLFAPLNRKSDSRQLLILNNEGRVTFSENKDDFPENNMFPGQSSESSSGYYKTYFWSKETSNQGWSIVSIIPIKELNQERNQWLLQVSVIFIIFIFISLLFAWFLWKMVYNPLSKFNKEVKTLIQTETHNTELTKIPEFDYLLNQVRTMKTKIWDLYGEVKQKEKRRADLEVEKLLYQINPHFLMNTLDTVHWLAVFNGNKEIDKLVLSLNKLLSYNLGKMGEETTVEKEIQAVKEYLQLQQIRYDFQFDVDIDVDENTFGILIPRFILQPLVENALYHGVSDDGYIHVDIKLNENLEITIQDNGSGMSKEEIDRLLHEETDESQKVGMGIGMRYVKRILESNYGEKAKLEIKSEVGKGTIVTLLLPVFRG